MKKLIIIVIVAAAVAGASWLFWPRAGNVETSALQLHGNVDIREVSLGFRVSGRLKEVLRDEGDEVKTGETLARLDDEPYRHEVDEACAQVDSLQARVSLLQAGNRPQEIAQAEAQVHEREVSAANTERVYKRQQELYQHKTISPQERDDAEAAYREATARLNSAREQFNLLKAGFRSEDITQAKAELARAEAMLAGARLKVADSVLQAPADGVVLTRAQEPGAILSAGATVLTVCVRKPVWVRAYIEEPDLGKIHPGTKAEIHSDSVPAKAYSGTVGYISPRAEFTPKNVETTELRTSLVYRLRIVVNDADDALRQGMPVTVTIAR